MRRNQKVHSASLQLRCCMKEACKLHFFMLVDPGAIAVDGEIPKECKG